MYCCRKYSLQKVAIFNCQHKAYNVNSWNRIKDFCGGDSAHGREGGAIDLLVPISALGQPHPYLFGMVLLWPESKRPQSFTLDDGISKWTIWRNNCSKWWWCQFGFCWCIKILALNFTCHRGSCWEVILGCCAVAFLLLYYSSSKALYTSNWIFWGKYSNDFPYPRYRTLSPFCRIFSNTMFSFQVCISLLQRCWFLLAF